MSEKLSDVEIIEKLKRDINELAESEFKVLCVYEIKNTESFGVILEANTKTYNTLMKLGKVKLGLNVCKVNECCKCL